MSTVTQTLSANQSVDFIMPATVFRLFSATGAVDVRYYRKGSEIAAEEGMTAGYARRVPAGFDAVRVTDASGASNAIKFVVADGDVSFDAPPTGDVNVANANGAMTNSRASVSTAAQILAANAARRYVLIQNTDPANAIRITMDGSTPTTSQGIQIPAGGAWESPALFAPTGAIKAIAESGTVAVEIVEG